MMRHLTILILLFALLFALLLAACTPVPTPTVPTESSTPTTEAEPTPTAVVEEAEVEEINAGESVTETSEAEALTGCLEPNADTQLISSPAAGFCFLIPANFDYSELPSPESYSLGIYGTATPTGHRERGFVDVTEASTQTLEESVQAAVNDVVAALPAFTPTQTSLMLGGLLAIQLDNLPGQEINRKIFTHNEGRLYALTFIPAESETNPQAYTEMEQLYALMLESFRFMPATAATSSYAPMLTWEGEIDGACHTLTIEPSGDATVAVCGDEPSATATFDAEHVEWNAVQQHFGSIDAETPAGKIIFQGQGSAESEAWAQALATWASSTAMEINAGRASATARTTLVWQLTTEPEHSGLCSQLIVLAYGYAYANQIPCDGNGQATQVAAGWLSDTELDTFNEWVTNGARVESELGYLDAKGSTSITPEELTAWANAVYTRMLQ